MASLVEIDQKMQRLFDSMGRSSVEGRWLKAHYNLKVIAVGDAIRMEQGELSEEQARELPLSTELGPDASLALMDLLEWVTEQLKMATGPVS